MKERNVSVLYKSLCIKEGIGNFENFFLLYWFLPNFTVYSHWHIEILNIWVHRCGTGGSMRACHAAGPGSIPDRDKFPGWGFFRGFSSPVRQISGSFRPQGPRISFGHHHPYSSFITGANDLRCWRALKPQIYILNIWNNWFTSFYPTLINLILFCQMAHQLIWVTNRVDD